jgi:carboxymethylenebutenolidase
MTALTEREVRIATAGGVMPAYVFHPENSNGLPAIAIYMDAVGIRDELFHIAKRLARAGYYCIVPDLYYRIGLIRIDVTRRTEAHAQVYRTLSAGLSCAQVAVDTAALLGFIAAEGMVREGKLGCFGLSIGGRFAVSAAGRFPDQIAAVAAVCPTGLIADTPDSAHLTLPRASGEFLLEFAGNDPAVPENTIPELRAILQDAGISHRIEQSADTEHGYNFYFRPMYHPNAAEHTWGRIFDLFQRTMRAA